MIVNQMQLAMMCVIWHVSCELEADLFTNVRDGKKIRKIASCKLKPPKQMKSHQMKISINNLLPLLYSYVMNAGFASGKQK